MSPQPAELSALRRLTRQFEAPLLDPATWRSLDQRHGSAFLAATIQSPIGIRYRPAPQLVSLGPGQLASLELVANPALVFGIAIQMIANQHHAAVTVLDRSIGENLFNLDLRPVRNKPDQVTSLVETDRREYGVVVKDWRCNHHIVIGGIAQVAPQHLSVFCGNSGDSGVRNQDVLPHSADLSGDRRRVARLVRHFLALPEHFAGFLVESSLEALFAAGNTDQLVAIDERRPGVAPAQWGRIFGA